MNRLRAMPHALHRVQSLRRFLRLGWAAALAGACLLLPPAGASASASPAQPGQVPVLAYYYIWYTPQSWDRAKADYPLLGRYSSDDPNVMREHIRLAKQAGITGFIVSWKSTDTLNARLAQLAAIAREQDFKLVVIYQGLDFQRRPLPVDQIARDFDYLTRTFGSGAPFDLFERPVVIWSGSWEFSPEEIAEVTAPRRNDLLILASERNEQDYARLAGLVDGDAYYWSSVDPAKYPGYGAKLQRMSDAVHRDGGLWFAPAAPGFDGRLVGHPTVVDRQQGATLRKEFDAAISSSPDAVALISWNEFSENSHIEPSEKYGSSALATLTDILAAPAPQVRDFASDEPGGTLPGAGRLALVGVPAIAFCVLFGLLLVRAGRRDMHATGLSRNAS